MNIDKIVKEYPRAVKEFKTWYWNKFEDYGNTESMVEDITLSFDKELNLIYIGSKSEDIEYRELNYRLLFDYFDSVGIYIAVYYSVGGLGFKAEYWNEDEYKYTTIQLDNDLNRAEAEYPALEKAFEIRQQQIEQNSKEN